MVAWKNETHLYHGFLMPLEHPNILRFIMASKMPSDNRYALVMEYHAIGSLTDLLKGRVITAAEADKIVVSMMQGISFLHDCEGKPSIAHRDFKSTNVLIKNDMTACIADFGLASAFEPDERIGDKHGQVSTRWSMLFNSIRSHQLWLLRKRMAASVFGEPCLTEFVNATWNLTRGPDEKNL